MRKEPFLLLFLSLAFSRGEAMAFQVESPAFQPDGKIPAKYTCDGESLSPPLRWADPPEGTKSFALISDDPDAPVGTWVHWVLYDIPGNVGELQEGTKTETLPGGTKPGTTDFKKMEYGGPCPPPGPAHRYFFKLYALDSPLDLGPGATKADFLVAAHGHILAEAELVGHYERR